MARKKTTTTKQKKGTLGRNGSWAETDFSIKVKKKLIDRRMSQRQLAEILGVTPGYISQTIYGYKNDETMKEKIRVILGIRDSKQKRLSAE